MRAHRQIAPFPIPGITKETAMPGGFFYSSSQKHKKGRLHFCNLPKVHFAEKVNLSNVKLVHWTILLLRFAIGSVDQYYLVHWTVSPY